MRLKNARKLLLASTAAMQLDGDGPAELGE